MRTRSSARTETRPPKSDDDVDMPAPSPAPKEPTPIKRRKKSKWDASTVLTNDRSPLAKCDLRAILQHPLAWDVLDPAERTLILSRFPDDTHIVESDTAGRRPDLGSLLNDNNFRHDCARYAEGISNGWHDEQWLWEAWEAHERRAAGEFDEVLDRAFEDDWGVKLHEQGGKSAGEAGDEKVSSKEEDWGVKLHEQGGKSVGEAGDEKGPGKKGED